MPALTADERMKFIQAIWETFRTVHHVQRTECSNAEFCLAREWAVRGVPLATVLQGITETGGKPKRLEACKNSVEQNIERWRGQVELAIGTAEKSISLEVNGLKISGVDLRGRYAGQNMPGAPAQPPIDRARMLAVAIEGSGDPYYFKFVGPARSVDVWVSAWDALLSKLAPA